MQLHARFASARARSPRLPPPLLSTLLPLYYQSPYSTTSDMASLKSPGAVCTRSLAIRSSSIPIGTARTFYSTTRPSKHTDPHTTPRPSISATASRTIFSGPTAIAARHESSTSTPASTTTSEDILTWDRFFDLRRKRRYLNLGASVLTAAGTIGVFGPVLASQDVDGWAAQISGLDPLMVLGITSFTVAAGGWLCGPSFGTAVFKLWAGRKGWNGPIAEVCVGCNGKECCSLLTGCAEGEIILRSHQTVQSRSFVVEYPEPHSRLLWREDRVRQGLQEVAEGPAGFHFEEEQELTVGVWKEHWLGEQHQAGVRSAFQRRSVRNGQVCGFQLDYRTLCICTTERAWSCTYGNRISSAQQVQIPLTQFNRFLSTC